MTDIHVLMLRSESDAGGATWGGPDSHRSPAHLVAEHIERLGHVGRVVAGDGALTRGGRVGATASSCSVLVLLLLLFLLFLVVLRPERLLHDATGSSLVLSVVLLLLIVLAVVVPAEAEGRRTAWLMVHFHGSASDFVSEDIKSLLDALHVVPAWVHFLIPNFLSL